MKGAALVRGVGVVSLGLAAVALVRPEAVAAAGGVRAPQDALPLLVRLNAARQAVLGLALLTRSPADLRRSARLFLPLTALDAVAVGLAARRGVVGTRSVVMAGAVLATNTAVLLSPSAQPLPSRWRRFRSGASR